MHVLSQYATLSLGVPRDSEAKLRWLRPLRKSRQKRPAVKSNQFFGGPLLKSSQFRFKICQLCFWLYYIFDGGSGQNTPGSPTPLELELENSVALQGSDLHASKTTFLLGWSKLMLHRPAPSEACLAIWNSKNGSSDGSSLPHSPRFENNDGVARKNIGTKHSTPIKRMEPLALGSCWLVRLRHLKDCVVFQLLKTSESIAGSFWGA